MIWHALAVLAVGTVLTGCVGDERPVVLVASSLRAALDGKGPDVRMAFASSGAIATQVRQGAAADAVVVADPAISAALAGEDRVEPPVTVARNRIAVLVPRGNPEGIQALADLAQPGRRVAVASAGRELGGAGIVHCSQPCDPGHAKRHDAEPGAIRTSCAVCVQRCG